MKVENALHIQRFHMKKSEKFEDNQWISFNNQKSIFTRIKFNLSILFSGENPNHNG